MFQQQETKRNKLCKMTSKHIQTEMRICRFVNRTKKRRKINIYKLIIHCSCRHIYLQIQQKKWGAGERGDKL